MPRASTAPVRVPGVPNEPEAPVPTTEAGETDADALAAAAEDLDAGAGTPKPEFLTLTPAQLDAAIQRGVERHVSAQRRAEVAPGTDAPLPDQHDIDRSKITRPTLSKQGYVIPDKYGEPKANVVKD